MLQSVINYLRRDENLIDLLRNSGILYVGGFVSLVIGFVQQILTANLLGAEDYGRLAVIMSSSLLVMMLLDFRTWEIGTKLITSAIIQRDTHEISSITSWLIMIELITGVSGTVLLVMFAQPVAVHLLQIPTLTDLVVVYAFSIPFRTLVSGVLVVFPRLFNGFHLLAIKSILYALLRLVFIGGAAWLGLGLQGVVISALVAEILHFGIQLMIGLYIQNKHLHKKLTLTLSRPKQFADGRHMLASLWTSSTLAALHYQTFIPFFALLATPAQVGLLRSGFDIAELIERTIQPVSIAFTPRIMSLYEAQDFKTFYRYLKQCFLFLTAIVAPLSLGVICFGAQVLPFLLREKGFEGIDSVLNILIIGFAVHTVLQWWLRPAGIVMGQVKQQNIAMFILIMLSFCFMLYYVPEYGAIAGASIKAGFYIAFSTVSLLIFVFKRAN